MRLLGKLFFSNLAALAVVVIVVLVSVRSVALRVAYEHMGAMTGGMADQMVRDLQSAISQGLDDAILVGTGAALLVAVVTSLLVSSLLTRPIGKAARAAELIAKGDYGHRVEYKGRDEVGEFAQSFNDMAAKLENTEAVRRELLATVSHELRTPLTSIQGYMEGLIDGVVPQEPETYHLVRREAERLTRLVGDIERLSRLEAGAEPVEPSSLATVPVVMATVEGLQPLFHQKDVELKLHLPEHLPFVWADEDKLSQILVNLLVNSLKYTAPGGHVTVAAEVAGDLLLFSVDDNGIGIPPEDLPHVFERFYRVDKSRSATSGGTGIGLAVVKTLVERMDGQVQAASTPGVGTRMTFTLKTAPAPPRAN